MEAKEGDACVEKGGGGRGISSRVADLDLKAEKVTLAPEHAVTPPALPCARTALTRTPALAHTRTRTLLQAALLDRLREKRPRGALAGDGAAQPCRAHSAALGAPESAGGERGLWPRAPVGSAGRGPERRGEWSGGPGASRGPGMGDASASLSAPPSMPSASARRSSTSGSSHWERHAARVACAHGLGRDVRGAESPWGPARPLAARGILRR